jgi:hypothetical protein
MTDLGNEQKTRFSTQVSPAVQARVRATVRGVVAATGTDYFGSPWPLSDRPLRPGPRVGG